jgi:hypothetical protein
MARDEGTFDFSANFEVKTKGTIDARQLVETFSDLLNFTESNFIPTGFPVSVSSTSTFNGTEYTNGIYECIDEDNVGLEASWKKTSNYPAKEKLITVSLGDIGASNFEDDIPTKIRAYAISNSITRELNTLHKWKLTENPFYYAPNGVTVVLKEGFPAGSSGTVDGDNSGKIYTALDNDQLKALKFESNPDYTSVCTTLVTNMDGPGFGNRFFPEQFNQPINSWDVTNVISSIQLFQRSRTFNQPLNYWNFKNNEDMYAMFIDAESFNQDLSGWCVPKIATEPGNFDTNTFDWVLPNSRPIWGTCPED